MVCTSVAVANPTTTVPTTTTTTTATASVAPASTTPTNTATDSSQDVAQGGPLSDVPAGHWAYDAVAQLVKDGLIKGYPDGQFKGNRPMTRYEAAVLTYRAVDQIEAQIAAGKAVEQSDIDAVKKLMAAFAAELKTVEAHLSTLDKSVAALKQEADATQLRVNQGKLGLLFLERPGTGYSNISVINQGPTTSLGATPGNVVPNGQGQTLTNPLGTTVSFGPGGLNSSPVGPQAHGENFNLFRMQFGGQLDPRWSYGVRVSTKLVEETSLGQTTSTGGYCTNTTSTNCTFSDLNNGQNTLPISLDYAYMQYTSPGGMTAQLGRYTTGSYGKYVHPPASLTFAGGQITGGNIGYNDPKGSLFAQIYVGIPSVSTYNLQQYGNTATTPNVCSTSILGLNTTTVNGATTPGVTGVNPNCNTTQNEIGAWFLYYFQGPRVAIGASSDNYTGKQFTFYNPYAINCTAGVRALGSAVVTPTAFEALSTQACAANGGVSSGAPGNYFTALSNQNLIEVYLSAYFGPKNRPIFNVAGSVGRHISANPFAGQTATGTFLAGAYGGANAYEASLTYASKGNLYSTGSNDNPIGSGAGRRNSNVVELDGEWYGLNSFGGLDAGNFTGTTPYTNNVGYTNPNGMYEVGIEASHWFSDSVRMGVAALHLQQTNGVQIPVGTNGTANTCPGCYVNYLVQNQVGAEFYLYFF